MKEKSVPEIMEFHYKINRDTTMRFTANVTPGTPGRAPSLQRQGEAEGEADIEILDTCVINEQGDEIWFGIDDVFVSANVPRAAPISLEEALIATARNELNGA
jgi:hypothetical protein